MCQDLFAAPRLQPFNKQSSIGPESFSLIYMLSVAALFYKRKHESLHQTIHGLQTENTIWPLYKNSLMSSVV